MKNKCSRCGKEFKDNYKFVNKYNKRIWCDECVDILYRTFKEKYNNNSIFFKLFKLQSKINHNQSQFNIWIIILILMNLFLSIFNLWRLI
jgi:hypothetical protein